MTHLSIDFGTSSTVAVNSTPAGVRPVLFDGLPSLASGVCLDPQGRMLAGREAAHAARTSPERFEPHPKQRIDERTVLLGESEVLVTELIAAVLRRVAAEVPSTPTQVTLTHPAAWGAPRRDALREAAARAGLTNVRLVPEPVAAAMHFVESVGGVAVGAGECAVVYDIGAGTFDATVVRRTDSGFEVRASSGLADGGGLDLDAAIVAHLGAVYSPRDPDAWQRLMEPSSPADRRASRAFWNDVRTGKEVLSRSSGTHIHIPLLEVEAPLGREQFEALARPVLDRTVAATRAVLRESGVEATALAGVFLVGGASRTPLVATLLHRALEVAPAVIEHPELAVAHGAALVRTGEPGARPGPVPTPPAAATQISPLVQSKPVSAPPKPVSAPPKPVSAPPRTAPGTPLAAAIQSPQQSVPAIQPRRPADHARVMPLTRLEPAVNRKPGDLAPTKLDNHRSELVPPPPAGPRVRAAAAIPPPGPARKRRRGRGWLITFLLVILLGAAGAVGSYYYGAWGLESVSEEPTGSWTPLLELSEPAPAPASADPVTAQFREATLFMQIGEAGKRDGEFYLTVRQATKQYLGESFETVDGDGPFQEVKVYEGAAILDLDGNLMDIDDFVTTIAELSDEQRDEGFDIYFNGDGVVESVQWLYVPTL